MKDINNLMLNWKHFPLGDIGETTLPPLHPILAEKEEFNPNVALKALDEALYMTIEEGKKFPDHVEYIGRIIKNGEVRSNFKRDTHDPKFVYDWINDKLENKGGITRDDEEIILEGFPISLGRLRINPTRIDMGIANSIYLLPENEAFWINLSLPNEIMEEYCLVKDGKAMESKVLGSWTKHNLDTVTQKIFGKNFAIAINNETVREKYKK
jgi:hypothetical protein